MHMHFRAAFLFTMAGIVTSFAGKIEILQVTPVGAIDNLRQIDAIQVTFNQPMVALGRLPQGVGSGPLSITPAVQGKFRWKGTDVLEFIPSEELKTATEYSIVIPEGLVSEVSKERLRQKYSATFQTPYPRVVDASPGNAEGSTNVTLNRTIYLQFDQPVDMDQVKKLVSIEPKIPVEFFVPKIDTTYLGVSEPRVSIPEKLGKKRFDVIGIKPRKKYSMWTRYTISIKAGVQSLLGGPLTGDRDYVYSFSTIEPLRFNGVYDNMHDKTTLERLTDVDPHSSLRAVFNNSIALSEFVKHAHISPLLSFPAAFAEESWGTTSIDLNQGFLPATKYEVTFDADLTDENGNKLGKPVVYSFSTGNYKPFLKALTGIGVVELAGKKRVPIEAVNIPGTSVDFWSLPSDSVVPFLTKGDLFDETLRKSQPSKQLAVNFGKTINERQRVPVYLDSALGGKPGILLMQTMDSWTGLKTKYLKSFLQVTNLGITAKFGYDNTFIAVSTLDKAMPVPGAAIEIRNWQNTIVWTGKTDIDGKVIAPSWVRLGIKRKESYGPPPQYVFARLGQDWAFITSDWEGGISPWRFGIDYTSGMKPAIVYKGTIVTERDMYRPGETVYAKGFVRYLENGAWQPVKHKKVLVTVTADLDGYSGEGEEGEDESSDEPSKLFCDTVDLAKIGSFEFKIKIPAQARLSNYSVRAHVVEFEKDMEELHFSEQIDGAFRIAEFRPVEMEVKVVPEKGDYFYNEDVSTMISSNYLFGAPVKNEAVKWAVRVMPYYFEPKDYEGFSFSDYSAMDDCYESRHEYSRLLIDSTAQLDEKGVTKIRFRLNRPEKVVPSRYLVEATVAGKSKQPVSSWSSIVAHPSDVYAGVRTSDYFGYENKPLRIETVTLSPEEKRIGGRQVSISVVKRYWVSVRKSSVDGRLTWDSERRDTVCKTEKITSHDQGLDAISFTPAQSGFYIVKAVILDGKDTLSRASTSVYVCGNAYASWKRSDDDLIEIIPDRKRYEPGQTARLLVKSPFKTARALVTVEREGVLFSKWVTLSGSASAIDLPIIKSYLPNVFVSVTLYKGRTTPQQFDGDGNDQSKPGFKMGYCELAVEPAGKRLAVSVRPEQTEYQPGDSASVEIQVPQLAGKTYASDVLVMAVDEGVLLLTGYKTPDVFSVFYGARPLCVLTSELRASVVGERNYGEKGQNRGGGGGMDPSTFARISTRGNFKVCAYFNPRVILDKDGKATVRFKLPDNLTSFRVMAVAQSATAEFGSSFARIKVNKKLMLRPFMPRFLRAGDSCNAGVVAENYSPANDTLAFSGEMSGLRMSGGGTQRKAIAKGSNAYVLMPIVAGAAADSIAYTFKGVLGRYTDGVTGTIPLVFERAVETVALSGSTADSAQQLLRIPSDINKDFGSISTAVSSTALSGLGESVRYLYEYPYGCLEQRTSCVLPLILFEEMTRAFGMKGLGRDSASKAIEDYLSMVPRYQCENGGFDYWMPPNHESPYITAYTLLALLRAEKKGYAIDKKCKAKALSYLAGFLNGDYLRNRYPYGDPEWNGVEAFIVAVLAEGGNYRAGDVERLYKKAAHMPVSGLAQLYKAVSIGKGNAQIRADLKRRLINNAKIEATTLHFEEPAANSLVWLHGTAVTTTAISLLCILEADGEYPQAEKAVRWIMQQQRNSRWKNTHENLYAFWAMAAYFEIYEKETPEFKARAILDGKIWLQEQFSGRSSKMKPAVRSIADFKEGKNVKADFVKSGKGRLYYQLRMSYSPKGGLEPRDEGIAITRSYASVSGAPLAPSAFKIGQPVLVTLTVTSKRNRQFVAVNDPVPAGCEIIDPQLSVVSPELARKVTLLNEGASEYWWGSWNHTEYKDQRCLLFADYLNAGTYTFSYLMRPTTTGKFYTPPAHAEEMYAPEVFGRTGECFVTINQ